MGESRDIVLNYNFPVWGLVLGVLVWLHANHLGPNMNFFMLPVLAVTTHFIGNMVYHVGTILAQYLVLRAIVFLSSKK